MWVWGVDAGGNTQASKRGRFRDFLTFLKSDFFITVGYEAKHSKQAQKAITGSKHSKQAQQASKLATKRVYQNDERIISEDTYGKVKPKIGRGEEWRRKMRWRERKEIISSPR